MHLATFLNSFLKGTESDKVNEADLLSPDLFSFDLIMTQTYSVQIFHHGHSRTLSVSDAQTILAAAQEASLDLPSSCNAGVCTTCAAKLLSGTVDQSEGMGVSTELQAEGYVLLCVAYPRSDVRLESSKEDEVYHRQFVQPST